MVGLVGSALACLLRQLSLGSIPDISQKYKMVDISKVAANTLYPANKICKNKYLKKGKKLP
jgi:hypothetical protein